MSAAELATLLDELSTLRGTPRGLVWRVDHYARTMDSDSIEIRQRYGRAYPHHVEGRIIDAGTDRGPFNWYVPSVEDVAYVFVDGVKP